MLSRALTAAFAVLAVAWAQPGLAASVPVGQPGLWALKLLPSETPKADETVPVVNLNLGDAALMPMAQGSSSLALSSATLGPEVRLDIGGQRNWNTYGDLFSGASSLTSSYLSGSTASAAMSFSVDGNFSAGVGYTSLGLGALTDNRPGLFPPELAERLSARIQNIGTTSANLNLSLNDWAALGITASRTNGNVSMLGIIPGSLGTGTTAESSALGISARVGFGEGWVTTLSYSEGVSQLDLSRDKIFASSDPVRSQGYGIAIAKQGLFGADALGIAVSQPLQLYTSATNFAGLGTNFAMTGQQARESDVELGYVTTFLDGTIALQANAAYQMNAAGAKGQNAVAGVARAKVNF